MPNCACGQPAIQATIEEDGTIGQVCTAHAGAKVKRERHGNCARCQLRDGERVYPVGGSFVRVCDQCWASLRGRAFARSPMAVGVR